MDAFQPFGVAAVNNSIMNQSLASVRHDTARDDQAPRKVATGE